MEDWLEYLILGSFILFLGLLVLSATALMMSGQVGHVEGLGYGEQNYVPLPHLMPGGWYAVY